jgi:hypothetical protein
MQTLNFSFYQRSVGMTGLVTIQLDLSAEGGNNLTSLFERVVAAHNVPPVRCAFSTMDSAVLGLGLLGCGCCTVCVFRQEFTLEDAIGSHACSLEALACV